MNLVILIGFVGKDPEIRSFENGDRVAQTTLATHKFIYSGSGQEIKTEWHRLRFYGPETGGLIDRIQKAVQKGTRISIRGELSTNVLINNEGIKIPVTYIDIRNNDGLEILETKQKKEIPEKQETQESSLSDSKKNTQQAVNSVSEEKNISENTKQESIQEEKIEEHHKNSSKDTDQSKEIDQNNFWDADILSTLQEISYD